MEFLLFSCKRHCTMAFGIRDRDNQTKLIFWHKLQREVCILLFKCYSKFIVESNFDVMAHLISTRVRNRAIKVLCHSLIFNLTIRKFHNFIETTYLRKVKSYELYFIIESCKIILILKFRFNRIFQAK